MHFKNVLTHIVTVCVCVGNNQRMEHWENIRCLLGLAIVYGMSIRNRRQY